jgi:hypothetical protein
VKRIPKVIYLTAEEIDARIRDRENVAMALQPASDEHRALMKEIAQLRVYSEAKRWMASPGLKPVT